jgi:hypothetical protein
MDTPSADKIDSIIRNSLRRAIQGRRLSYRQISEALTERLDRPISVHILRNWASESKWAYHLPADAVPVLCEILMDDSLQRNLLSGPQREALKVGEFVINSRWVLKSVKVRLAGRAAKRVRKA